MHLEIYSKIVVHIPASCVLPLSFSIKHPVLDCILMTRWTLACNADIRADNIFKKHVLNNAM